MPKFDLIIRGGRVLAPEEERGLDIAVSEGRIVELSPEITGSATEEIDAAGLHVFPGLIDAHVHFNEPGRTEWEGFATGSAALAAGGGTCFIEMPLNASPPTLDGRSFDSKRAAAEASSLTDFALWGGLTPDNLDHLDELAERGVVGFKAFMCDSGIVGFSARRRRDAVSRDADRRAAGTAGGRPCREPGNHVASDGGNPRPAAGAAGRIISHRGRCWRKPRPSDGPSCSRATPDARCMWCTSARPRALRSFAATREDFGQDVTCETCPHYLLLNAAI